MRSMLFVPGDSSRKQEKGLEVGADALILDLEDSVAPAEKPKAREVAAGFLARMRDQAGRPKLYIRVNALDTGLTEDDLAAVMPHAPDGIMLPKAEGGPSVAHLGARLAVYEAEHGLPDGATRILPIATETARAVFALSTLPGSSPRLSGITWGAEDLSADIGAETNRGEDGAWSAPFQLARNLTLMAAAAAEVDAIDTINAQFRDLEGLARECRAARRDGFVGKMAIHPAQVAVINEAFTPTDAAIAQARTIVAAFAAAPGVGVVGIDGEMFDRPHLRRAERLLARAE
ncbi:CoA ester lyase [Methylobacterium sp. EM32]|uniref:HpcH/HpaI aldolase/citrate lyase family protein n=1 Tax=Methylobacterium sp. EM32 TaxID=3163481 RepID=UPI0033A78CE5